MAGAADGTMMRVRRDAIAHPEGAAHVHELVGHALHVVHDEQHLLEEGADEDDGELLRVVDADPDDRQRDETHHRHVANEIDQRLQDRLRQPIRSDEHPEGDGEHAGDGEAHEDPIEGHGDVLPQRPVGGQLAQAPGDDGRTREEELGGDPRRRDQPPRHEQPDERQCCRCDVEADGDVAPDAERWVTAGSPTRSRRFAHRDRPGLR